VKIESFIFPEFLKVVGPNRAHQLAGWGYDTI